MKRNFQIALLDNNSTTSFAKPFTLGSGVIIFLLNIVLLHHFSSLNFCTCLIIIIHIVAVHWWIWWCWWHFIIYKYLIIVIFLCAPLEVTCRINIICCIIIIYCCPCCWHNCFLVRCADGKIMMQVFILRRVAAASTDCFASFSFDGFCLTILLWLQHGGHVSTDNCKDCLRGLTG